LACLSCGGLPDLAHADTGLGLIIDDEVIVTATRSPEKRTEVAVATTLITASQLESVQAVAVSDVSDPDTSDNTARVVVRPVRPTVGYERLADGRFAVTWPGSVTGASLQQAGTPSGPWAIVPGTPETTPLGQRLVIDPSASARFYRLGF
jgi:hypothetical protein